MWTRTIFGCGLILLGVGMYFFPQTKEAAWFPMSFGVGFTASAYGS